MKVTYGTVFIAGGAVLLAAAPLARFVAPAFADLPAPSPSTQPAATADERARIEKAIVELASRNFAVREKAANTLWGFGARALPSLREAAAGDDPEVAGRAKALLENFEYGVRPDTPKVFLDLLDDYRAAGAEKRGEVAQKLAAQGVPGVRILLKLANDERDGDTRQEILAALVQTTDRIHWPARSAAAELIAGGEVDVARQLVQAVASQNEATARDEAALLSMKGGADDQIKKLEKQAAAQGPAAPAGPPVAPVPAPQPGPIPAPGPAATGEVYDLERVAYLHRAKGDLPAAIKAIDGLTDRAPLAEALMAEAGQWKELAARVDQRGVDPASVEDMGYALAWHRLAGDAAGADGWAKKIAKYPEDNPNNAWGAAEALLLNDRVQDALGVLVRSRDYLAATEFYAPRLQYDEVLAMVDKAKADGSPDLPLLRAKAAVAYHYFGKKDEATKAIESVFAGEEGAVDFATCLAGLEAARATNQPIEKVDRWCVVSLRNLRANRWQDQPVKVFEKAGFDRPDRAAEWWVAVRDLHGTESPEKSFATVRALDRKEVTPDALKQLLDEARGAARNLPPADRDARLQLVADTLADFGRTDEAIEATKHLASRAETPGVFSRLGDLYADAGKWPQAAEAYGRAFDKDRSQPLPLLLRGHALEQSGHKDEGRALVETAHVMPLADQATRREMLDALLRHGLKDEARIEADVLLRTAEPGTLERGDAVRRTAEAAQDRGDELAAADWWGRAVLTNLSPEVKFIEPEANLMIPLMVHRLRAEGLAKAGRFAGAVSEAKLIFENCPGEADAQIGVVRALQDAGRKAEADSVYAPARALYAKQAADHPESAPTNNLLAWFESRCRRDLDDALRHGRKAAELEPTSAAILDTLAEVHFQRREFDAGIELVKKCLALEPNGKHHRKNLERFEAAKSGKPAPELEE